MTEQDLHEYNKWLMEVWNPNQLYIPFAIDAPRAYLKYKNKQCNIANVRQQSELLKAYESMLLNAGDLTQEIKDNDRNKFIEAFNCA